jgi:hypothetical protein
MFLSLPTYATALTPPQIEVLAEAVARGDLSLQGADLIAEVLESNLPQVEAEATILALAQERDIQIEGENKFGLMARNIVRVIVGAIRPSTGGCPTHDGRGRRNSP